MSKARRSFTAEQKADVVRRHLKDKVTVGELSAELGIQPSQIHQWVATALAQVERAFQGKSGPKGKGSQPRLDKAKDRQIKRLEEKLQVKNEVISELMEENVKAKKANGDL